MKPLIILTSCLLVELKKGKGKSSFIPCETFSHAADICNGYITKNQLGSSNFTGGSVYHPTKGKFAYVSYNLRVWKYSKGQSVFTYNEIVNKNSNNY